MSEGGQLANRIARQLWAMSSQERDRDLISLLRYERYPRTFSDEYPFRREPQGRFAPVDPQQKREWEMLANFREFGLLRKKRPTLSF